MRPRSNGVMMMGTFTNKSPMVPPSQQPPQQPPLRSQQPPGVCYPSNHLSNLSNHLHYLSNQLCAIRRNRSTTSIARCARTPRGRSRPHSETMKRLRGFGAGRRVQRFGGVRGRGMAAIVGVANRRTSRRKEIPLSFLLSQK